MRLSKTTFVLPLMALQVVSASADDNADKIKALNDQSELITAQQKLDKANLDAITTQNQLKKAKAENDKLEAEIVTDNLIAQNDLEKAKLASQTATLTAAKAAFGEAPAIGKDGNIQISDATAGQLLTVKSGSLKVTAALADELCKRLRTANISDAFIVPADLNTKLQAGALEADEFNRVSDAVDKAKGGGAQAQVAPLAILSALSLVRYGADSIAQISKLMRSDRTVTLSQTSRESSLAAFVSVRCPAQIPTTNIEIAARGLALERLRDGVLKMEEFAASYEAQKKQAADQLADARKSLASAKSKKAQAEITSQQARVDGLQTDLSQWQAYQPLVSRIDALTKAIATKPQEYFDALTWDMLSATGDFSGRPRLTLVLTTQDAQIIKDNFFLGKRLYGVSSGELIYSAVDRDGAVLTTGYVTASDAMGKIDMESNLPVQGFSASVATPGAPVPAGQ